METIDNLLLPHILIEFIYNDYKPNRKMLLEYSFTGGGRRILLEKYGVFPDCEKIADAVINAIVSKPHKHNEDRIVDIDGDYFFEKICLIFNDKIQGTAYRTDISELDDNGKLDVVIFDIGKDVGQFSKPSIMHELQHAYEDWNMKKNGDSLDNSLDRKGYFSNLSEIPAIDLIDVERKIFYIFNKSELNAYMAQIVSEINSTDEKFNTIGDLFAYVRSLPVYCFYTEYFSYSEILCTLKDKPYQDMVLEYANKIKGNRFKNYNSFSKWLRNQTLKTKRKLDTIISKAIYEKFRKNMVGTLKSPSDTELNEMLMEGIRLIQNKTRK